VVVVVAVVNTISNITALSTHTSTTNGLRHDTQFGVPVREKLVTVCVVMRSDAGQVQ